MPLTPSGALCRFAGALEFDVEALSRGLGEVWETLAVGFKPYPCGHVIHAFLDAALRLRSREKIDHARIESLVCRAAKGAIDLVLDPIEAKRRPRGGYDAKFSLPYCLASVFVRGRCGVEDFEESAIGEPEVLALANKISWVRDDAQDFPRFFPGVVEVRLDDGRVFREEEKHQRGCAENPMSDEDVLDKFRENAGRSLAAKAADDLAGMLMELDSLENLAPVGALLRSAVSRRAGLQSP